MLVTRVAEAETYAVVGGGRERAAQVAASAAAFRTMTDSLYRDKIHAVAREVICNAIDAHVDANVDLPVKITLTPNEFKVRDFGKGIPDDKMVDIYFTLFGSSKEMNSKMIGGFGLGAKSPFAITDHFIVTSHHDGMRHTYLLHTGDEESRGIPGLRVMSKGPTTESGLEVCVPINTEKVNEFERRIKQVVFSGGIKATLNGDALEAIDYSDLAEGDMMIVQNTKVADLVRTNISLLIGNVLYPIDNHPDLNPLMTEIRSICDFNSPRRIIRARPSTISITPSRESLSYDEESVMEIKRLLKGVLKNLHDGEEIGRREVKNEIVTSLRKFEDVNKSEFLNKENEDYKSANKSIIIGAREIGRIHGRIHGRTHFIQEGWRHSLFHIRDYRSRTKGYLNRHRVKKSKKEFYWGCTYSNYQRELRYRRMVDTLSRTGLIQDASFGYSRYSKIDRLLPIKKMRERDFAGPNVMVLTAQFRQQALDAFEKAMEGSKDKPLREGTLLIAFIDRQMTQERKEEIEAGMKRFGYAVTHLKPIEREVKPKKPRVPKDTLTATAPEPVREWLKIAYDRFGYCYAQNQAPITSVRTGFKPKSFYGATPGSYQSQRFVNVPFLTRRFPDHWSISLENHPLLADMAVATGTNDRNAALKLGIPRIESVILEEAKRRLTPVGRKKAVNPIEAQYCRLGEFYFRHDRFHETGRMAVTNRLLADELGGFRAKPAEAAERDEAWSFWTVAWAFMNDSVKSLKIDIDPLEEAERDALFLQFEILTRPIIGDEKSRLKPKRAFYEARNCLKQFFEIVESDPRRLSAHGVEFCARIINEYHKHKENLYV